MTTRLLHPHGRASALPDGEAGREHSIKPEYDMIAHLRIARENGDEAMTAAEEYDPDFSIKLSNCVTDEAAETLLAEWLDHRLSVLKRTQEALRQAWRNAPREH